MANYLEEAFYQVCSEAKRAGRWYVCLIEHQSYYGGPEEGGWHGCDTIVVAYQEFATEEAAETAASQAKKLANEWSQDAKLAYSRHCRETTDWLDARGLDADYLLEPDGPASYKVIVTNEPPENHYGPRHYE